MRAEALAEEDTCTLLFIGSAYALSANVCSASIGIRDSGGRHVLLLLFEGLVQLILLIVRAGMLLMRESSISDLSEERWVLLLDDRGNLAQSCLVQIHLVLS